MTMVINGSGTITGLSAGGLPDATIQQADLATGVAGTGPAFSVYSNGGQSLAVTTLTKIQLQNKSFDTASAFDSTTNYRFQPLVAGYYQVNGRITLNNNANNNIVYALLYKNGACVAMNTATASNTAYATANVASVIYLNGSTDYVELYGYQSSPSTFITVATTFNTGDSTNFSGALVRAA